MASYDPVPPDSSAHKIPRKKITSELVVGLESPSSQERHAYDPVSSRFHDQHEHDDPESDSEAKPPRERSPLRWWSLEILSCFAAAACLAGIVALLAVYDGQPQDSWRSDVITLNGVVAFLATLCRTFFMVGISAALAQGKWNQLASRNDGSGHRLRDWVVFDDAAKGPWGSLQLIWRFRGLHIACVGAVLTILSLAFGLFAQQLVDLEVRQVELTATQDAGRVLRTTWAYSKREDTTASGLNLLLRSVTRLAVFNGFMAPDIDDTLVTCATGNCTWPVIPTVGVCGACVDTTASIRVDVAPGGLCNVTAPGNLTLRGTCEYTDWAQILDIGPGSGEVFARVDGAPDTRDAHGVVAEFGVLGLPSELPTNTTIDKSVAAECALWYCVQARGVRVLEGELRDDIVETWSRTRGRDGIDAQSQRDEEITFTDIPSSFNTDPDEKYGIQRGEMMSLRAFFAETMVGNVTLDGGLGIVKPFNDFSEAVHIGINDMDRWIERLAKSMTNNLRSLSYVRSSNDTQLLPDAQPAPDLARYAGTAMSNQVFFAVYWSWLAYPAAMVCLAALYLVLEATRTALLRGVRPWKDDIMVPLSMSLDEQSREMARASLVEPKGARKRLGAMEMTVTKGDDGFPTGFVARED